MSYVDLISGRGLQGDKASRFRSEMLRAYPNDPVVGCPFDGSDTEYGEGSQYKRMAAIATDTTFTEAWSEYLETFSSRTKTWGLLWEQPLQNVSPAYGVVHGSDISYYIPTFFGKKLDPRTIGQAALVYAVQDALINFITDGTPNGCSARSQQGTRYIWPLYSESHQVTVMNASRVAVAERPPHRPGFDIIHRFLRPGPFQLENHWDGSNMLEGPTLPD